MQQLKRRICFNCYNVLNLFYFIYFQAQVAALHSLCIAEGIEEWKIDSYLGTGKPLEIGISSCYYTFVAECEHKPAIINSKYGAGQSQHLLLVH